MFYLQSTVYQMEVFFPVFEAFPELYNLYHLFCKYFSKTLLWHIRSDLYHLVSTANQFSRPTHHQNASLLDFPLEYIEVRNNNPLLRGFIHTSSSNRLKTHKQKCWITVPSLVLDHLVWRSWKIFYWFDSSLFFFMNKYNYFETISPLLSYLLGVLAWRK